MCYGNVDPNDPYGRAVPVPPVDDPVQIYTRLFGTIQTGTPEQITRVLHEQEVGARLRRLRLQRPQVASWARQDGAKLDQHLTNIRSIEDRLTKLIANPALNSCPGVSSIMPVSPAREKCLRDQDLRTATELAEQAPNFCVTNFREIGKLQMDLMILALSCDLTRVASLQWSTAESTVIHTWLPLEYSGTREHHLMTHNETVGVSTTASKVNQMTSTIIRSDLTKIGNWYAQQFAYMLGQLKGIQEANGTTLLDNMLMFWTNELGIGGTHSYTNVPYVIAGNCQGQMQTGRYIDFWGNDPHDSRDGHSAVRLREPLRQGRAAQQADGELPEHDGRPQRRHLRNEGLHRDAAGPHYRLMPRAMRRAGSDRGRRGEILRSAFRLI